MHPLGRVALGMLFPKEYGEMVALCEQTGESLQEQERRALPIGHAQVMAHLLASWNIPQDVFLPLKFASDEYSSLIRLSEPLRTKIELVKVAIVLGRLAAGKWHSWDLVQLPSASLLKRLRIANASEILSAAKSDLAKLSEFSLHEKAEVPARETRGPGRPVWYCNVAGTDQDLLLALLPSMGLEPQACAPDALGDLMEPSIVNCISVSPKRLAGLRLTERTLIVADQERRGSFNKLAATVALPTSYARLKNELVKSIAESNAEVSGGRVSWIGKFTRGSRLAPQ
jgi:hypothetical protein